jgi:succinate dehydrogenase/fumarate reductase flavoprotein subunit
VFGHRAGVAAAEDVRTGAATGAMAGEAVVQRLARALRPNPQVATARLAGELQQAMQRHALVEKNEAGLSGSLQLAQDIESALALGGNADAATLPEVLVLENMATTARIILHACRERRESRSGHFRTDHPVRDDSRYAIAWSMQREGGDIAMKPVAYAPD